MPTSHRTHRGYNPGPTTASIWQVGGPMPSAPAAASAGSAAPATAASGAALQQPAPGTNAPAPSGTPAAAPSLCEYLAEFWENGSDIIDLRNVQRFKQASLAMARAGRPLSLLPMYNAAHNAIRDYLEDQRGMHPAPQPLIRDILGLLPVEATLEEMMDDYGNERRQVASYVRGLSGHTDIDTPSRQQLSSMIYSYFLNHGPVGNDAKADAATALELLEARQPYFVTRKEWVRDHLADYDAAVQACAPLQGQTTVAAGEALHDLHSRRLDLEKSFTRLLRINRLLGQELEPQMQKMPAPYRDNTKTLDFLRLFATDARSAQPGRDRVKLLIGEMIAGRRVKESKQEIGAIYDGFAKLCRELPPGAWGEEAARLVDQEVTVFLTRREEARISHKELETSSAARRATPYGTPDYSMASEWQEAALAEHNRNLQALADANAPLGQDLIAEFGKAVTPFVNATTTVGAAQKAPGSQRKI